MTEIEIGGKAYTVEVRHFDGELEVRLIPKGEGDVASSFEQLENYGYTHGGKTYRAAVEKAWEIQETLEVSQ